VKPARHQREQVIQPRHPRSKIIISQHETGVLPQISKCCCRIKRSGFGADQTCVHDQGRCDGLGRSAVSSIWVIASNWAVSA
jgi:hypothetical protein